MEYITNHGYVKKLFDGSNFNCGYYAWIEENGNLTIGEERGREGGILYRGNYQKEKTPFLKNIMHENITLYKSIVKHFEGEVKYYFARFVKRSQEENCRFCEYLAEAIDKAEQAISNITYNSYPELNMGVIYDIKRACEILDDVLDAMDIKKPM